MSGRYDIVILQGETFEKVITWKDKDGNIVPLAGYTAKMQIRTAITGGSVIAELSTENGKIVIANDTVTLNIPATETELMTFETTAYYDLELTTGTTVKRLIEGVANLSFGVTK